MLEGIRRRGSSRDRMSTRALLAVQLLLVDGMAVLERHG
jgi:hypothetical protein